MASCMRKRGIRGGGNEQAFALVRVAPGLELADVELGVLAGAGVDVGGPSQGQEGGGGSSVLHRVDCIKE